MKNNKIFILYCGDDNLRHAARYLYGVLNHLGYRLDYVPSRRSLTDRQLHKHYDAIILSDYPSVRISRAAQEKLVKMVDNGTGLLMIGGWGSFHGYDGNYDHSKLAKVLPVRCLARDDRVNCSQGGVILPKRDWDPGFSCARFKKGPLIGGYNKVVPRPGSKLLLAIRDLQVNLPKISLSKKEYPLLVAGCSGKGRTACYMSDLAPHWAGGLVDWGQRKIKIENAAGYFMEVGQEYIKFVQALITLVLAKDQHG
ncbi:MAG: glutamine amidotransferase [bacterium]|nr:glutamine amidotransferase [bacterium]MDD5353859.1 glutamine amidotransferase [bacterium]MDD5757361.1 glutamine amidotransferase [bacterium]